jgi:hypothetical protein
MDSRTAPGIGERAMKLHIGCGSVYLRDWVNIDIPGDKTFLAEERPDLVEALITDESDYYFRHRDKTIDRLRSGPLNQETVCDRFGSFSRIPARAGTVSEILARHCFEHLSIGEASDALREMRSVMAKDGVLRLDVPDHEQTLERLIETRDRFFVRHLLGPRRDNSGFHMMSYTRERLTALVGQHGFVLKCEEPNIHIYPAFCLRFEIKHDEHA